MDDPILSAAIQQLRLLWQGYHAGEGLPLRTLWQGLRADPPLEELSQLLRGFCGDATLAITSLSFVAFFVVVALLCAVLPRVARPVLLLIASYAFYLTASSHPELVVILIAETVLTYIAGLLIGRLRPSPLRTILMALTVLLCTGVLLYFKYFNFFGGLVLGEKFAPLDLVAPMGLSYFTFTSLGYVLDIYLNNTKPEKNPIRHALFIGFFPCIFTGPIERKEHLAPQFAKPPIFDYNKLAGGAFRMLWGYVKKMVVADHLGLFVSSVFAASDRIAGPVRLAAILLFTCQLYMDFSGCCDIAIGGARMLGVELLENFAHPFAATSYTELWNRWHISLTSWFRDYLFTPISFYNRGAPGFLGKLQGWFNVFLIFPISGLWHGASVGYLVWGALNGLIMVLDKSTTRLRRKLNKHNPLYRIKPVKQLIQRCGVSALFIFCAVFFAEALYGVPVGSMLHGLTGGWGAFFAAEGGFFNALLDSLATFGLERETVHVLAALFLGITLVESRGDVALWIRRRWFFIRWPLYLLLAAVLLLFGVYGKSAFIYQLY